MYVIICIYMCIMYIVCMYMYMCVCTYVHIGMNLFNLVIRFVAQSHRGHVCMCYHDNRQYISVVMHPKNAMLSMI